MVFVVIKIITQELEIESNFKQRLEFLKRGETVPSELQNELNEQLSLFYFAIDTNFEIKKEGIHFLIYSRNQEPEIIKDYLCKEGNKKIQSTFSSEIDEEEEEEKIDIYEIIEERRHHICDSVEIDSSESKRINSNLFIASDTMNEKATMHRNIVRKRTIANVSKIPQLAYDQDQYLQKATQSFFDTNNKSFY